MPYPISVAHILFPLCCSLPFEAFNTSFAASHCSLGYLGIFQLLHLGFLIGTRMPEGEKRKGDDDGVSKVWVGQNTDFSELGEEGASLQASKRRGKRGPGEIGEGSLRNPD